MKVAKVLRLLERDGWVQVAQRGSHRQFKHDVKLGRVTVAGKPSDDLAPGTLNSILKQAGFDVRFHALRSRHRESRSQLFRVRS